jgi:hypothetical protein
MIAYAGCQAGAILSTLISFSSATESDSKQKEEGAPTGD